MWDQWARELLGVLTGDPWQWHGRAVLGADRGDHGPARLSDTERAVQRSLYWNLSHAASSGALIRPSWSLQVAWSPPATGANARRRMLSARVVPREAGRRFYAAKDAGPAPR
jgi:hypothetical protein